MSEPVSYVCRSFIHSQTGLRGATGPLSTVPSALALSGRFGRIPLLAFARLASALLVEGMSVPVVRHDTRLVTPVSGMRMGIVWRGTGCMSRCGAVAGRVPARSLGPAVEVFSTQLTSLLRSRPRACHMSRGSQSPPYALYAASADCRASVDTSSARCVHR